MASIRHDGKRVVQCIGSVRILVIFSAMNKRGKLMFATDIIYDGVDGGYQKSGSGLAMTHY
jgi:hypothetical protein